MKVLHQDSEGQHWRGRVLGVVDDVYSSETALPWGALRMLFATLDHLRSTGGAEQDVKHVERVAVSLHHLQALCSTAGSKSYAARDARRAIRRSTLDWLQQTRVAELA